MNATSNKTKLVHHIHTLGNTHLGLRAGAWNSKNAHHERWQFDDEPVMLFRRVCVAAATKPYSGELGPPRVPARDILRELGPRGVLHPKEAPWPPPDPHERCARRAPMRIDPPDAPRRWVGLGLSGLGLGVGVEWVGGGRRGRPSAARTRLAAEGEKG